MVRPSLNMHNSRSPDVVALDAHRRKQTLVCIAAVCLIYHIGLLWPQPAWAQPETSPLVVMNLAAHPDDEDGTTLAYYRHGRDAIAYSVIFTRGEGGQNEIGPELYEELGAIRTRETERAARLLGTQVYFLNFDDFGFSKTAEETFEMWGGRDAVTARLVHLIRKLKPDVLFTNHDTVTVGPARQHGHHQAVGLAAYDAFELAADSSYYPEQLEEAGVDLWQPKRLFRRLWSNDEPYDVTVPVGEVDEPRSVTYAGIAADALYEHASQGMDRFAERIRGWTHTYFQLVRSHDNESREPDDLAAGLRPNRAATPDITYWIDSGRIRALPAGALSASESLVVPGNVIEIDLNLSHLPDLPARLTFFGVTDTSLVVRSDTPSPIRITVPEDAGPTIPRRIYQYTRYLSHPPLGYSVANVRSQEVVAAGYLDIEIAPHILLEPSVEVMRLKPGSNVLYYTARAYNPSIRTLNLTAALSRDEDGNILSQHKHSVELKPGSVTEDAVSIDLEHNAAEGTYMIALSGVARTEATRSNVRRITVSAFVPARVFDAEVPDGLRVGVIESYDNTLDAALKELTIEHRLLDSLDLAHARFDDLHTIVVDIRGYLVRNDLRAHNRNLLDWVRGGGHLVVNYHKTFEWNPGALQAGAASSNETENFAPFPLELGRDRVTGEDAEVTVLLPDHPLLNVPNELGAETWEGWVQERGLYFPAEYDERYEELFSLNDPEEEPLTGSTLFAEYGSGTYLYTALVWYRQLKEFHSGAYRAFANMMSFPLVTERPEHP